jgi:putative transposase
VPRPDRREERRATHRVAPTLISGSVGAIVGQFKSTVTKRINEIRNTPGRPVWQRNYYEHIIRDEGDLNRIREYIINNPARWAEDENNPINAELLEPKIVETEKVLNGF